MSCKISAIIKEIPLYRELYGTSIDNFDLHTNFQLYPAIEKMHVARNFPNNWMTAALKEAVKNGNVEYNASSGTTSERMQIVRSPKWWVEENQRTYAFDERLARVNSPLHRKVVLTTAICSNTVCFAKLPDYEERIIGTTLYLNISSDPNSWKKNDIERMMHEINRFKPHIYDVDPIYFAIFFKLKDQYGLLDDLHRPEIIIYTYEYVTRFTKLYCDSFMPDVSTVEFYGSTETGYNLFSLETGGYKHVQDRCYMDFDHIERDIYAIKISSWKNLFMPLINYRINDLFRLTEEEAQRPTFKRCGQPLLVKQLCGRLFDTLKGRDGSLVTVGDIELALSSINLPLVMYQLRVFDEGFCQFRYVTVRDQTLSQPQIDDIKDKIFPLLSSTMKINFVHDKSISPEASGKFAVIKRG